MRKLLLPLAILASVVIASPAFAQGRGIGRSVRGMARNGVHGPALAGQVKQLQAVNGIGAVNGQGAGNAGSGIGGQGKVKGKGRGGPGAGGPGMGKGKGGKS